MAKIFVVGLGPGGVEQMTKRAVDALNSCDVIAGYHVYVNLIKEDFADKKFLSTGMRKEVDRCKLALEEALKGQTVAMISSGDAGVYGMAGIMYQVAADHPELEIEGVVFTMYDSRTNLSLEVVENVKQVANDNEPVKFEDLNQEDLSIVINNPSVSTEEKQIVFLFL